MSIKWNGRGYELHAVNRRYTTPFRDSRLGQVLQLIALAIAGFAVALVVVF